MRESLIEREVLWAMAPHIIWPLRFVLPHHNGLRPAWLLRLGLFLYDHLGGRKLLPPTKTLDLRSDPAGKPLKPEFTRGFEYSDCWVDDARLVVLNAQDAADARRDIRVRTEVTRRERERGIAGSIDDRATGSAGAGDSAARISSTPPGPGSPRCCRTGSAATPSAQRPAGQGQPHRRAAACSTTTAPISSRTPTGASSSPSPTSTTSR